MLHTSCLLFLLSKISLSFLIFSLAFLKFHRSFNCPCPFFSCSLCSSFFSSPLFSPYPLNPFLSHSSCNFTPRCFSETIVLVNFCSLFTLTDYGDDKHQTGYWFLSSIMRCFIPLNGLDSWPNFSLDYHVFVGLPREIIFETLGTSYRRVWYYGFSAEMF